MIEFNFIWRATKQGHNYWEKLLIQWVISRENDLEYSDI